MPQYHKRKVPFQKEDKVFLIRNRISRIYYCNKFFDYPVNLSFNTIKNLGFIKTIESGISYLKSMIIKNNNTKLEIKTIKGESNIGLYKWYNC